MKTARVFGAGFVVALLPVSCGAVGVALPVAVERMPASLPMTIAPMTALPSALSPALALPPMLFASTIDAARRADVRALFQRDAEPILAYVAQASGRAPELASQQVILRVLSAKPKLSTAGVVKAYRVLVEISGGADERVEKFSAAIDASDGGAPKLAPHSERFDPYRHTDLSMYHLNGPVERRP